MQLGEMDIKGILKDSLDLFSDTSLPDFAARMI